ncbi:MAG: flagellar basal-body rod protein FlgG [Ignavibacteria bacterium]|nr:MAG: flagellar basal-body rod protein FlgG [Ignavibacteria bacterium]
MPTKALRTAASGMYAQQKNIEIIANNIANVNSTGFKKSKAEFQDLMYQQVPLSAYSNEGNGVQNVSNEYIYVGNGVKVSAAHKLFQQGDLVETGNPMDIGINGEGFFQVLRPDGTYAYTRDGTFKINAEGQIVNSSGFKLVPEITLDETTKNVTVTRSGEIQAIDNQEQSTTLDEVTLVKFINPAGLKPIGDNLFVETEYSGPPIFGKPGTNGFGEIYQGYMESSNVDIVEEMINMITAQRAYEINSKTVKTIEEMMTIVNQLKRG